MTGTQLIGATAVVTGGQRGLGKSIVDALLDRGVAKVYATSRTPSDAEDPRVVGVTADVTDDASIAELANIAAGATIVVNNAGALGGQSLLTDSLIDVRAVMETNFYGPLRVTRAFLPILKANGGGTVVNIASVLSWLPGYGSYGTSKAAGA